MNAEKQKAMKTLLGTVNEVATQYGHGIAPAYLLTKLRRASTTLGFRKELDAFMQETWGLTIRKSKKKVGKKR